MQETSPDLSRSKKTSISSEQKDALQTQEQKVHSMMTENGPPNTGHKADAGTDLPSGRASEASSVATFTNVAVRTSSKLSFREQ